jgi:hypothetical protein
MMDDGKNAYHLFPVVCSLPSVICLKTKLIYKETDNRGTVGPLDSGGKTGFDISGRSSILTHDKIPASLSGSKNPSRLIGADLY